MSRIPALLALVAVLALSGCSAAGAAPGGAVPADAPGIVTRGVGTVTASPDVVTVVLGVQTRDGSAKAALDANSERAAALIEVLKGAGVAPADLRTSQLSVYPTYDPDGGRIIGYEVTNLVTATLRDVAAAGGLIDAAAAAAGDAVRVQELAFSIADDSAVRATARADAVRQALAQAAALAEAAGVRLGPIRSITEVPAADQPRPYLDTAQAAAVPIEPGTQQVAVVVEVVHGIAP